MTNKIKAQATFIHVEGIGLVMPIDAFNTLMAKFQMEKMITSYTEMGYGSKALKRNLELQNAMKQRRQLSSN